MKTEKEIMARPSDTTTMDERNRIVVQGMKTLALKLLQMYESESEYVRNNGSMMRWLRFLLESESNMMGIVMNDSPVWSEAIYDGQGKIAEWQPIALKSTANEHSENAHANEYHELAECMLGIMGSEYDADALNKLVECIRSKNEN